MSRQEYSHLSSLLIASYHSHEDEGMAERHERHGSWGRMSTLPFMDVPASCMHVGIGINKFHP